jgi:hypothetical protein
MDTLQLLEIAASAIETFLTSEPDLLTLDVNERSLTARLAMHIQHRFPEWHVDCEYNRLEEGVKRLPRSEETRSDDRQGRTIYPDIIVHRRGERANLLVIEVKKHDNDDTERDLQKLTGLTSVDGDYGYRHGIHLVIDCSRGIISNVNVYTDGKLDRVSLWLKFRLFGPESRKILETATAEFHRRISEEQPSCTDENGD